MGQSNPKDNRRQVRGGIYIQLQKTYFVSNEVIHGLLNINLEEPFQGHILQVTLSGVEETSFTFETHREGIRKTIQAQGHNAFLNFQIPIYDFAQGQLQSAFVINPCQLVIPFQLAISDKIPSSVQYFCSEKIKCSLKYSIIAEIISTEPNVKPVYGSQEIFIGQQIPSFDLTFTSTAQQPELCYCCKPGYIQYSINRNQECYSPNEVMNLSMEIDFSQFSKTVNELTIKLVGQLSMKADNTVVNRIIELNENSINVKVQSSQMKSEVQFKIPGNIPLSSKGQLIEVIYYLYIIPKIDTFYCVSDSSPHYFEIQINPNSNLLQNSQNIPQLLQIQAPQNWNPNQLQPSQFNQNQLQLFVQQKNQQNQQNSYNPQYENNLNMIQPSTMIQQILIKPSGQPQMINQNQKYI
ncbi:arrestin (macronuclear) [Tetrahymena thermophila SB210]|uniref:Arrestin n=1 Tax=Tetrahymena thermophila (strain SB210) TaxID=312017 RepID=Q229J7_TETTS|nr:arrestin [Tetrahymena thermophila SB210]EAR81964.1 arrestin [Tetrahymena thermophila SB210]|eukprot:XP_001029627.1 arrestin [Tetrahymena thermophila SB210]